MSQQQKTYAQVRREGGNKSSRTIASMYSATFGYRSSLSSKSL